MARQASTFTAVRRRTPEGAGANDTFAYYLVHTLPTCACVRPLLRLRALTKPSQLEVTSEFDGRDERLSLLCVAVASATT